MSGTQFRIIAGEAPALRRRDTSRPVLLVGFLQQGNLGLGYLAAQLRRCGYNVIVADFESDPEEIVQLALSANPCLIGFSLIFQFYAGRFESLARRLRSAGLQCHFTMGGHFPSLSYQHCLELVPQLDSIVRFEGEITLLELADAITSGDDWRAIQGIAHRRTPSNEIVLNPSRPLIEDLDTLPWPERNFEPETILGHRAMPLLASRGCARTCSFCSIHTFYRAVTGKIVRTRDPRHVVEEMSALHRERGINIFLFQDDDFPLFGPVWKRWTRTFLDEMHHARLPGRVIFKINCRADAVDPDLFAEMRAAGLYLVYMGLESGSEDGLETLHKQITVEQNLRAVAMLKLLGLMVDFGFMMFDPSTTFDSIRDNVRFLQSITGDGSAAAVFCRMLPYDGTPIKVTLEKEGRLRGDINNPDYDFLDPRIGRLYTELSDLIHVTGWIHGHRALSPQLNWAWNEAAIMERLFPPLHGLPAYQDELRAITNAANNLLFEIVTGIAGAFEHGRPHSWTPELIEPHTARLLDQLLVARGHFVEKHRSIMLDALNAQTAYA